ncbi:MAG TPA: hypothetical protein VL334_23065 [Anaerolineae bacterium]|nr:hypothetical protein [Anaerolineae bacterium]
MARRQVIVDRRSIYVQLPGRSRASGDSFRPGGKIFFTNFSDNNPFRAWMYYLINWTLIERSYD